jgi:uncharacterized protein YjbI with pentapeptide repeats
MGFVTCPTIIAPMNVCLMVAIVFLMLKLILKKNYLLLWEVAGLQIIQENSKFSVFQSQFPIPNPQFLWLLPTLMTLHLLNQLLMMDIYMYVVGFACINFKRYSTPLYATLRYSTLRYSTLHYSTLLYATLRCSTLLYATLRYSTLLYATLRYYTLLYATLRYSTLLYATIRYSTLLYVTQKTAN